VSTVSTRRASPLRALWQSGSCRSLFPVERVPRLEPGCKLREGRIALPDRVRQFLPLSNEVAAAEAAGVRRIRRAFQFCNCAFPTSAQRINQLGGLGRPLFAAAQAARSRPQ
jgi:hypothetical protein